MAENTPIALALALAIVSLLAWRLKPSRFHTLRRRSFAIAAALFWGAFSAVVFSAFWAPYYSFFVPPWERTVAPFVSAVLYAFLALALRWLAIRLPGNPVLTFCLLGGLESLPEHAIALSHFRILEIPILQGSTPGSILFFAYFEYVVCWGIVLVLVNLVDRLLRRPLGHATPPSAPTAASA